MFAGAHGRGWLIPLVLSCVVVLAPGVASASPAAADRAKLRSGSFHGVQLDFSEVGGMEAYWTGGEWDVGFLVLFRPQVLLGMYTKEHPGFGPYLEIGFTTAGTDLGMIWGGGLTAQVPLHRRRVGLFGSTSIAFSAGGFFREATRGFDEPGVVAGVLLLWHDYNTISYVQGLAGLRVEGRYDFGPQPGASIIVAVQVDMSILLAVFAWL